MPRSSLIDFSRALAAVTVFSLSLYSNLFSLSSSFLFPATFSLPAKRPASFRFSVYRMVLESFSAFTAVLVFWGGFPSDLLWSTPALCATALYQSPETVRCATYIFARAVNIPGLRNHRLLATAATRYVKPPFVISRIKRMPGKPLGHSRVSATKSHPPVYIKTAHSSET